MEEQKDLGSYSEGGTVSAAQVPCAVGYTPGPWNAVHRESGGYDCMWDAIGINADGDVFDIVRIEIGKRPTAQSMAENWANGRLIAAAPELLSALKAFLKMYLQGANSGDWGNWDPEQEPEIIAVRAAIAKALGQ